jgi:hypothetical protein
VSDQLVGSSSVFIPLPDYTSLSYEEASSWSYIGEMVLLRLVVVVVVHAHRSNDHVSYFLSTDFSVERFGLWASDLGHFRAIEPSKVSFDSRHVHDHGSTEVRARRRASEYNLTRSMHLTTPCMRGPRTQLARARPHGASSQLA